MNYSAAVILDIICLIGFFYNDTKDRSNIQFLKNMHGGSTSDETGFFVFYYKIDIRIVYISATHSNQNLVLKSQNVRWRILMWIPV